MPEKILYGVVGLLIGIVITALVILCVHWQSDYSINIVDFLTLIATMALSVAIVYLTKMLDHKDIVRHMLIADFDELCNIYRTNSDVIQKLNSKDITIDAAREEIKMTFHKGDLLIDCLRQEISESFPDFKKNNTVNLIELTSMYYKWLTDGEFMTKGFQVSSEFQKAHETKLRHTLTTIKLVSHKLAKSI